MWANTARWIQEKAVDVAQRANVAAEEVRLTCVAFLLRCFCHFVPVISCHSSAVLRFHNIIFNLSAFPCAFVRICCLPKAWVLAGLDLCVAVEAKSSGVRVGNNKQGPSS